MVLKPSNPKELRLVIDYRQVNEFTIKDKYPLPDVQSLLDDRQGATVFSTMDALWGFWQIPMGAEDVEKTAMTTHFGAYEWLVMPMGLSNSPSAWQRMMTQYLGHLPFCRVFVDDIMIFSAEVPGKSAHEVHLDHLRQVLEACREYSVYLKKSKVKLCKRAVRFLGHVVDRDGCRPQQDKVASVRDWPDLETVTHVRQFLGMCGFYRRYIQNFADLAYPLTRLTKSGVEWTWGENEKAAFNQLKTALISSPALALPDQKGAADGSRPFFVQTDASGVALGARELISRRQARWYEDLVEVGVHQMEHVPGRCLVVPDAQSRRPDYQEMSAREGLKEKGIVDRATDGPRDSEPKGKGSEEDEDPTSVLSATFEYTDTLAVGEKSLRDAESLAVMTRADRAREQAAAEGQGHPEAAKEASEAVESPRPEVQRHPKAAEEAPEPVKSPGNTSVGSSHYDQVVDRQDWKLIRKYFEEIAAQYGMFDVDACCDSMGRDGEQPDEPLVTSGVAAKVRAASGPLKAGEFVRALQAEYERSPYLSSLKEELVAAPHQRTDTFRMVDDMIWRVAEGRYQLVLAQDSPLRELVMREAHESPAAGHTGRDKTLDR
eukprot:gene2896-biopygen2840